MSERVETLRASRRDAQTIEPSRGHVDLNLSELWRYRELLYILAWRDIKVRYKQTVVGIAWAVIQPLVATALFSVVFGRLAGFSPTGVVYPLFAYAGFLAWTYVSNAVSVGGVSLVRNASLVSKVYFPRIIIPFASMLPGLLDLAIGILLLVFVVWANGALPGGSLLLVPFMVGLLMLASVSVSVWFSALDVRYRDVRYALPFLIQVWLFASPVFYPIDLIPTTYRGLYLLNPLVGAIEGFRWSLLGGADPPVQPMLWSFLVSMSVLALGVVYFRRSERTFADAI